MPQPHQALIKGCVKRDPHAQRELYERFSPRMLAICYRYARTQAEAEDILQEGFVKIFQNLHKYQDKGSFEGWIKRIIINCAIDHIRKEKAFSYSVEINDSVMEEGNANALDHLALQDLLKLIQQLPDGYRLVFNLYAIEGYSHAEIGKQLEISESTSRSQYARARAMLKKKIREIHLETYSFRNAI